MSDKVTVTQADREAAAPYANCLKDTQDILEGKADGLPVVQAFARHRIASQQSVPNGVVEAEKPAAWLYDYWLPEVDGAGYETSVGAWHPVVALGRPSNPAIEVRNVKPLYALKQSGQTEAELLREARDIMDGLQDMSSCTCCFPDNDCCAWAKADALIARIDTHLSPGEGA